MRTNDTHKNHAQPTHPVRKRSNGNCFFANARNTRQSYQRHGKQHNMQTKKTFFSKLFTEIYVEPDFRTYCQPAYEKVETMVSAQRHPGCPVAPLVTPNHVRHLPKLCPGRAKAFIINSDSSWSIKIIKVQKAGEPEGESNFFENV